jgi:hypothetical protein
MSLSLAITINAFADAALLGGLAYAMSRTTRLTPHVSATPVAAFEPARVDRHVSRRRPTRSGSAQRPARASSALGMS